MTIHNLGSLSGLATYTASRKPLAEVISEYTLVKFDVEGRSYVKTPSEAIAFAEGLLKAAQSANVKFTEIVPCRTTIIQSDLNALLETNINLPNNHKIVIQQDNSKLRHELHMCFMKGGLSTQDFIELMRFQKGVSNDAWAAHIPKRFMSNL